MITGINTTGTDVVQIQDGTEIAGIAIVGSDVTITLTLPLLGTVGANSLTINGSFLGSNGGTLIIDAGGDCYQKTNYRGDPHEFGAFGDANPNGTGSHDDTVPIQRWLGAYGNLSNLAPNSAPYNFGPWNATVPGNFLVSQPLFCPPNATIRGDENLTDNNIGNQTHFNPRVNFIASSNFAGFTAPYVTGTGTTLPSTFVGSQAVFGTGAYCRLSGIAVTGNAFTAQAMATYSALSTTLNLGAVVSGLQIGNPVSGINIPADTVVTGGALTTSVTISQPTTGSNGNSAVNVTFYGPDAVDALGNRLTIDGFSLLANGRYNLFCGLVPAGTDGVSIKDSSFQNSLLDGIYMPSSCANARLIGDIVADSAGDGVLFGATESEIEGGVIEESGNAGLHLQSAQRVSINGMHIQGNGLNNLGGAKGAGIVFENTNTSTICGNHLEGNGGDTASSSQVYFAGKNSNINLCGGVYEIQNPGLNFQNKGSTADVTPFFVYDSDSDASIINTHIYETAEQPAVSVFSANAKPLLSSLVVPQFTSNQIGGLTMSLSGTTIQISPGSAADSTNSAIIQLPATCTVDFSASAPNGAFGVDAGSSTLHNQTYFIYIIAAPKGGQSVAATPSCMASTMLIPRFTFSSFGNSGYLTRAIGGVTNTDSVAYNVSPTLAVAVGNMLQSSTTDGLDGATITQFSANAGPSPQPSGIWSGSGPGTTITICSGTSPPCTGGIKLGMAILGNGCIPSDAYVTAIAARTITVSNIPSSCTSDANGASPSLLSISGARQLVLNKFATSDDAQATLDIGLGYYRMIGAVMTDASGALKPFRQDGDTFYFARPAPDVAGTTLGTSAVSLTLASVPNGISVRAFGRCVGGGTPSPRHVMIFSPDQPAVTQTQAFPIPPGYDVDSLTPVTSFPFSAWTDTSQSLRAISDAATPNTATIECLVDGWEWHRGH
ncbi:MAG TPA: right-handed parallel beta-helix repeat-containing protein [Rhizomicrobium sp.]|nr:right-handed parallel beta-helix repeat-containing protein [Rhizomicrobium sp.]